MAEAAENASQYQGWLDRLQAGDKAARDELVSRARGRLTRLTRQMLRDQPGVHRWEETDDVVQNAVVRLWQALESRAPKTVPDFFRLAALIIRRELIDLARHHFGPEGAGAHHASDPPPDGSLPRPGLNRADSTRDPERLAAWTEFHEQIERLPDEEREVFDLLWYGGLAQTEAATLLGISERTLQRRWQAARLKVHDALQGRLPI